MPFNLLLLPLLGGYWLLRRWNRTRFLLARQDVQRTLLWSATAGFVLVVLSALGVTLGLLADARWSGGAVARSWHALAPFVHSGKAVGALLLGGVVPLVLNGVPRWRGPAVWAEHATEFYADEPEMLVLRALRTQMPVLLTLRTGKVYVGFVQRNLNPEVERRHLRLLPVVSGYRAAGSLEVHFTTLYEQIREEAHAPDARFHGLLDRDFEIVIPMSEVTTMSLFDFDAYEAFNRPPSVERAPARRKARRR